MFKKLNAKPLRANLVLSVILILIGAIILGGVLPGVAASAQGAEKAAALHIGEMEGRYVEAEINFIWEPFAYTGDTEETADAMFYMVAIHPISHMDDFETAEYIGLEVSGKALEAANVLYERTNIAWNTWDVADLGKSIVVKGVVESMDSEEQEFFDELLVESGMEDVAVLPLILRNGTVPGGQSNVGAWLIALLGTALVAWAAVLLVRAFSGYYQKDLRAWCAASVDPAAAQAELEEFYAFTEPLPGDIRINDRWLLFVSEQHARLLDPTQVVWAYTSAVKHRTNGIPTGTTYAVVFVDAGGKRYNVPVRKQADAQTTLNALFPLLPGTLFGYNAAYEKMPGVNNAALAQLAAEQHAAQPAAE